MHSAYSRVLFVDFDIWAGHFVLAKCADYIDQGSLLVLTTGYYCFKKRGLLAQVWKKREAQVLSFSTFQCEFGACFSVHIY